ncbi:MAG: hypothetical protein Q9184_005406 [Pyrenodesmia sp. 2 TL-2023]
MKTPFRISAIISAIFIHILLAQARSQSREPITYLSLVENPEIRAPSHRIHALSEFDLVFDLHQSQQQVKLTLEPNHDIIAQGATVTYLDQDGKIERAEPINRLDHRVFRGESWVQSHDGSWMSAGWARITVRKDGQEPLFEGAFTIGRDHHHILLRSNYLKTKHDLDPDLERGGDEYMIAYRDSDIFLGGASRYHELKRSIRPDHSCSSDHLTFNTDPTHPVFAPAPKQQVVGSWGFTPISSLFGKRQFIDTNGIPTGGNSAGVNLRTTIGQSEGCPTTRRVALVGVATDCGYTASFDSEEEVRQNIIQQFQTASNLYERTFSITLGLQNLTISRRECPATPPVDTPWNTGCGGTTTITDRLNMFSAWRGERSDSNAYWMLLTSCSTGSEVGLAWLGQLCVTDVMRATGEVVSGANVVARTANEWQVIAHETGHTFGAVHDCDSSACANQNSVNAQQCCPLSDSTCDAGENFIMNPSTGQGISAFSQCTLGNVCSAIGRNSVRSSCLTDNRDVPSITGGQCGNGIVEGDEECSGLQPYAMIPTIAAAMDVNSQAPGLSAEPAPVSVIHRRRAPATTQHVHLMSRLQMANLVAMACNAQADSAHLGISNDCTLSCASPEFGPGVCYSMQQNFLDGTPCGGGGRCSNGQCRGSSTAREIGSWINDNKPIVIGVSCGVGGLILLAILGCCIRRCRRPKRVRARSPPMQQGWVGGPMPQGNGWNNNASSARGSRGAPPWNGPMPPPLPPQYMQPSVRYA